MRLLPAALRARMLDAIEAQLRHEPRKATRQRKPLRGKLAPAWELRVGQHRVFYLVEESTVKVTRILRKSRKTTEELG